jgi:hypothetical protein
MNSDSHVPGRAKPLTTEEDQRLWPRISANERELLSKKGLKPLTAEDAEENRENSAHKTFCNLQRHLRA